MQTTQLIQSAHNPSAGLIYSVAKLADQLHTLDEDASVMTLGEPPEKWPYKASLKIYDGAFERSAGAPRR